MFGLVCDWPESREAIIPPVNDARKCRLSIGLTYSTTRGQTARNTGSPPRLSEHETALEVGSTAMEYRLPELNALIKRALELELFGVNFSRNARYLLCPIRIHRHDDTDIGHR